VARQKADRAVIDYTLAPELSLFAIDPGDVHVGFARLDVFTHTRYVLAMGVIHRDSWELVDLVDTLRDLTGNAHSCVVEDYRIRPVGHQRFNHGSTLRLLGALEYVINSTLTVNFATVPPGNPVELEQLRLRHVINAWREGFALRPNAANWRHADSAWRALALHMSTHHWRYYEPIVRDKRGGTIRKATHSPMAPFQPNPHDLYIEPVEWTL